MEKDIYLYTRGEKTNGQLKVLGGWKAKKVLAFSPHADDLSIAAGGFLHMLSQNNRVQPVLGFTGWRGVNSGLTKEAAIEVREKEMVEEAKVLGSEAPIFLRLLSYESTDELSQDKDRQMVADLINQEQPEIIFLPSQGDSQPRHRALTNYVRRAVQLRGLSVAMVYYETPWSLFAADQINLLVPLDKPIMVRKTKAIKAHASQIARTDFAKISRTMLEYRALTIPEQIVGGFGSQTDLGKWMEVFQLRNDKEE
jgi:LmbE family N-acetylglucosaminyl deacetylase